MNCYEARTHFIVEESVKTVWVEPTSESLGLEPALK